MEQKYAGCVRSCSFSFLPLLLTCRSSTANCRLPHSLCGVREVTVILRTRYRCRFAVFEVLGVVYYDTVLQTVGVCIMTQYYRLSGWGL